MTTPQMILTIAVMAIATMATRFLPFVLFHSKENTPRFVQFLGKQLAGAVFGMLIVYCLKDVQFTTGNHGIPQLLGILVCVILHLWRKSMFLTIAGGTTFYLFLVHNFSI